MSYRDDTYVVKRSAELPDFRTGSALGGLQSAEQSGSNRCTSTVRVMSTTLTPGERTLRAQIAANESWARCENRSARTLPARIALMEKFEYQVDPQRKLLPAERAKRAENARKAYYQRLALKSAQARRRK